jgi:hypothetical protein
MIVMGKASIINRIRIKHGHYGRGRDQKMFVACLLDKVVIQDPNMAAQGQMVLIQMNVIPIVVGQIILIKKVKTFAQKKKKF